MTTVLNAQNTTIIAVVREADGVLMVKTDRGYLPVADVPGLSVGTLTAQVIGQQLATSSAAPLPSHALLNGAIVKASPNNTGPLLVGLVGMTSVNNGSGTGYELQPGESWPGACSNTNQIYIILASGNVSATDFIYYTGN